MAASAAAFALAFAASSALFAVALASSAAAFAVALPSFAAAFAAAGARGAGVSGAEDFQATDLPAHRPRVFASQSRTTPAERFGEASAK